MRYTHCMSSSNEIYALIPVRISLTDDTQHIYIYVYLVNLKHCTHLIGVQKSVDFFDNVILSHRTASGPLETVETENGKRKQSNFDVHVN